MARTDPSKLEPLLKNVAQGFGTLSPELLLELLSTEQGRADKAADLVLQVASRMTDTSLAGFVARGVIAEGGATTRLAQAFQALVPDSDRRASLLEIANRCNVVVSLRPDLTAGRMAPAVRGRFTVRQAFGLALQSSGLQVETTAGGTLTVRLSPR